MIVEESCPIEPPKFEDRLCGIPLQEVDYSLPEKTFCAIGRKLGHHYVYRFSAEKAYDILDPFNPYRKFCVRLVTNQYVDAVVFLAVIVNCSLLALKYNILWLDVLFLVVFLLDVLIWATARGLVSHKYTYLRDVWNSLDFTVTLIGLIELLGIAVGLGKYAGPLKSVRPLRLLKVFTIFPGLCAIMDTIVNATTKMFEVIVLLFFCIVVFALLGLQMFMSVLKQRCVANKERLGVLDRLLYRTMIQNRTYWMRDGDDDDDLGFVCGNFFGA